MSTESKIQAATIRYAKKKGMLTKRNYMGPGAETGWPDVEFFPQGGEMFFIEFKKPGGELSARQEFIIRKLLDQGYRVHVCDSIESGERAVDVHC